MPSAHAALDLTLESSFGISSASGMVTWALNTERCGDMTVLTDKSTGLTHMLTINGTLYIHKSVITYMILTTLIT